VYVLCSIENSAEKSAKINQQEGIVKNTLTLPENVVVRIFKNVRHEAGLPRNSGYDKLSTEKESMATTLGKSLNMSGISFSCVICSMYTLGMSTAGQVVSWQFWDRNFGYWHHIPHPTRVPKGFHSAHTHGSRMFSHEDFMRRYMKKARDEILVSVAMKESKSVAIFTEGWAANAIAEALFPKHEDAIAEIVLDPLDHIRLTETSCEHFRCYR
jgi:hypothetical protein